MKRAEEFERQRRYDLARETYRAAIQNAPDSVSGSFAAHRYGGALAFWGELENAETELARATVLDPSRVAAWHDLGIVRSQVGDLSGAEVALREAKKRAPSDVRPRIAVAALLVKTKRYAEADAEYRELLTFEIPEKMRDAIGVALELLAAERGARP